METQAILDRVREAAEQAAAAGVLKGAGDAWHAYGPTVLTWEAAAIAAGVLAGTLAAVALRALLRRLVGLKG